MIATINVISVGCICMYTMNLCLFFFNGLLAIFFNDCWIFSNVNSHLQKVEQSLHFSTKQTTKKENNSIVAVFWFLYNKSFGMTIEKKVFEQLLFSQIMFFYSCCFIATLALYMGSFIIFFCFVCYEFSF